MNLWDFDVSEFLSCGIDPNIVIAVQLLRNLSLPPMASSPSEQKEVLSAEGSFSSIFDGRSASLHPHDDTDEQRVLAVVRLAVCCCAFFHGFETISDSAADRLTAIVANNLEGMVREVRSLADKQRTDGRPRVSSKNPVHQVLESRALPASVLLTFYNSRVVRPCRTIADRYLRSVRKRTESEQ